MNHVRSLPAKCPPALRPSDSVTQHCKLAESLASEVSESDNIQQAWTSEHGKQWHDTTDGELKSLVDTHT